MSKATNVRATLIAVYDHERLKNTPGAFAYTYAHDDASSPCGIVHSCPCGCKNLSAVYFKPGVAKAVWALSGTREAPTLSPSVGIHFHNGTHPDREADGYHWHGYLRDGVWVSV